MNEQGTNAPPDLQALVVRFGTYDKITPEAWAGHDAALAEFRLRVRLGIGRGCGPTISNEENRDTVIISAST